MFVFIGLSNIKIIVRSTIHHERNVYIYFTSFSMLNTSVSFRHDCLFSKLSIRITLLDNNTHLLHSGVYSARHTALRCGVPLERPAYMVNRLCGSGFQSVVNAAQEIKLGTWFTCYQLLVTDYHYQLPLQLTSN